MNKIVKRCVSCSFRHYYCPHFKNLPLKGECKHWKLGECYTCKYKEVPDEEFIKRGCELEFPSGCIKYTRDWKKIWKWFKWKIKDKIINRRKYNA